MVCFLLLIFYLSSIDGVHGFQLNINTLGYGRLWLRYVFHTWCMDVKWNCPNINTQYGNMVVFHRGVYMDFIRNSPMINTQCIHHQAITGMSLQQNCSDPRSGLHILILNGIAPISTTSWEIMVVFYRGVYGSKWNSQKVNNSCKGNVTCSGKIGNKSPVTSD